MPTDLADGAVRVYVCIEGGMTNKTVLSIQIVRPRSKYRTSDWNFQIKEAQCLILTFNYKWILHRRFHVQVLDEIISRDCIMTLHEGLARPIIFYHGQIR